MYQWLSLRKREGQSIFWPGGGFEHDAVLVGGFDFVVEGLHLGGGGWGGGRWVGWIGRGGRVAARRRRIIEGYFIVEG